MLYIERNTYFITPYLPYIKKVLPVRLEIMKLHIKLSIIFSTLSDRFKVSILYHYLNSLYTRSIKSWGSYHHLFSEAKEIAFATWALFCSERLSMAE